MSRIIWDAERRKFIVPPGGKHFKSTRVSQSLRSGKRYYDRNRSWYARMKIVKSQYIHSLKIKVVNVLNNPTVRITCRILGDVADGVKMLKPRDPWTYFQCGAKLAVSLIDNLEVDEYMYFEADKSWGTPFTKDFSALIMKSVAGLPTRTLKTSDKGIDIRLVDLGDDLTIGWVTKEKHNAPIWAPVLRLEETRQRLIEILWKRFEGNSIVVSSKRVYGSRRGDDESERLVFEVDSSASFMTSELAKEQAKHLLYCMQNGVKRTVLYYGPPGTGKTTMVQTMVKALNLRSLRFTVADLGGSDVHIIYDAIDIFKPDVVIIDDIDRIGGDTFLFDFLTVVKERVKFILATANRPSMLDEGILRPGRFDELVAVTRLDDGVTRYILGEEYAGAFEDVKDFPIAYIQEYRTQRRLRGHEEATAVLRDLQNRVKRLSEYYNEVDVDTEGRTAIAPKRTDGKKRRRSRLGGIFT